MLRGERAEPGTAESRAGAPARQLGEAAGRPTIESTAFTRAAESRGSSIHIRGVPEQELVDEPGEPPPAIGLRSPARVPRLRDGVVPGFAVVLALLPGALDPALLLESHERGVERALIEHERMFGHLLETRGKPVGVLRPHRLERAEHDQIERALQAARRVSVLRTSEDTVSQSSLASQVEDARSGVNGASATASKPPIPRRPD